MRTPLDLPPCRDRVTGAPISAHSAPRSGRARRSQLQAGSRRPSRRPPAENRVAVTGCGGGATARGSPRNPTKCPCLPCPLKVGHAAAETRLWPLRRWQGHYAFGVPPCQPLPGRFETGTDKAGKFAPTTTSRSMTGARGIPHRPRKCDHLIVLDGVIQFATRVAKIAGLSPHAERIGTGFTPIVGAGYGRRRMSVTARSDPGRKEMGAANRPRFDARIRQHVLPISAVIAKERIFTGCVAARGPRAVAGYKTRRWRWASAALTGRRWIQPHAGTFSLVRM